MANIFLEAVVKQLARTVTPSPMSAAQWAEIPTAIRERSLFSARVTNTRHLQTLKDKIDMILAPRTERNDDGTLATRGMDIATARRDIKDLLTAINYDPGADEGTIKDLGSDQRIELQLKQNVESAQGFGNFVQGTAPGVIDAYPAQELFRAEDRMEPRDWEQRWQDAGGQMFGGRMIAMKSSPIWEAISAFGVAWPPFDYGSGMWVRDVDRDEAIALGLMHEQEQVVAPQSSFKLTGVEEPALE